MYIDYIKKIKCKKIIFVITIFERLGVLLPKSTNVANRKINLRL